MIRDSESNRAGAPLSSLHDVTLAFLPFKERRPRGNRGEGTTLRPIGRDRLGGSLQKTTRECERLIGLQLWGISASGNTTGLHPVVAVSITASSTTLCDLGREA